MTLTKSQLAAIMPTATPQLLDRYYQPLIDQMTAAHIDTPLRIAHFLAQIGNETGDLHAVTENLNYSADALIRTWPSLFNAANAPQYAHQPEKIANRAYGNRYGNGPESTGDGWRYRGRGVLQLTFPGNYAAYGKAVGQDFLSNPDLVADDPKWCVGTGTWFFTRNDLLPICDRDDIYTLRKRVNGGLIGVNECIRRLGVAKEVLGI